MKKFIKVSLIIASALLFLGLCLCALGYALGGVDAFFVNNEDYKSVTATFDEVYSVEVDSVSADVRLISATSDEVKVTYPDTKMFGYRAESDNGKLEIRYEEKRHWYEYIGISFSDEDVVIVIELPQEVYEAININTTSGDISVSEGLVAKTCAFNTTSGELRAELNANELVVNTTSGDVVLSTDVKHFATVNTTSGDVTAGGTFSDIKLSSTSGDTHLSNISAKNVTVSSTSGEVEFSDMIVSGDVSVNTLSGDVSFAHVNAENYSVETTSGDVRGTITEPKIFDVNTTSGEFVTPHVDNAKGFFRADTTSGDVIIEIKK